MSHVPDLDVAVMVYISVSGTGSARLDIVCACSSLFGEKRDVCNITCYDDKAALDHSCC